MDNKTLYTKLSTVPPSVKSWLGSDSVIDILEKLPRRFNLSAEATGTIAKLLQRLQIRDLGVEYFAGQLSLDLNLDKNKAVSIVEEIKKTILNPIKSDLIAYGIDLAQLEKFNLPVAGASNSGDAPKIIQDIGPIPMSASMTPAPSPAQKASVPMPVSAIPSRPIPTQAIPPAPKPAPLSEKGWSKASASDPVIKFAPAQTPPPMPTPKPAAPVTPPASQPSAPQPKASAPGNTSGGEFARFAQMQKTPGVAPTAVPISSAAPATPPSAPKPSAAAAPAAAGQGPMMLHEISQFKTIDGASNFHISLPAQNPNLMDSSNSNKGAAAPKAAMIEIGKAISSSAPSPASKVVHYTDFKPSAPTASTPQTGAAARNVTEVTPGSFTSVPVPIPPPPKSAPAPVPPPSSIKHPPMPAGTPPMPPSPQSVPPMAPEKVINKDYLGPEK